MKVPRQPEVQTTPHIENGGLKTPKMGVVKPAGQTSGDTLDINVRLMSEMRRRLLIMQVLTRLKYTELPPKNVIW